MSRGATAAAWRARLDERLEAQGVPTAVVPLTERTNEWIPAHMAAAVCPAGARLPREDFVETAATAARALALTALRSDAMGSAGPSGRTGHPGIARPADKWRPGDLVGLAIADPSVLRPGLADFLRGLDRAGRAAVVASSTRWLVDAVALAHRRGAPSWQDPTPLRHIPSGCGVTLSAGVDAVRRRHDQAHLFVVRLRQSPSDDRLARRSALLWAVVRGDEPASVVLGYRESLSWFDMTSIPTSWSGRCRTQSMT